MIFPSNKLELMENSLIESFCDSRYIYCRVIFITDILFTPIRNVNWTRRINYCFITLEQSEKDALRRCSLFVKHAGNFVLQILSANFTVILVTLFIYI